MSQERIPRLATIWRRLSMPFGKGNDSLLLHVCPTCWGLLISVLRVTGKNSCSHITGKSPLVKSQSWIVTVTMKNFIAVNSAKPFVGLARVLCLSSRLALALLYVWWLLGLFLHQSIASYLQRNRSDGILIHQQLLAGGERTLNQLFPHTYTSCPFCQWVILCAWDYQMQFSNYCITLHLAIAVSLPPLANWITALVKGWSAVNTSERGDGLCRHGGTDAATADCYYRSGLITSLQTVLEKHKYRELGVIHVNFLQT